jgi:hypothetical protein
MSWSDPCFGSLVKGFFFSECPIYSVCSREAEALDCYYYNVCNMSRVPVLVKAMMGDGDLQLDEGSTWWRCAERSITAALRFGLLRLDRQFYELRLIRKTARHLGHAYWHECVCTQILSLPGVRKGNCGVNYGCRGGRQCAVIVAAIYGSDRPLLSGRSSSQSLQLWIEYLTSS